MPPHGCLILDIHNPGRSAVGARLGRVRMRPATRSTHERHHKRRSRVVNEILCTSYPPHARTTDTPIACISRTHGPSPLKRRACDTAGVGVRCPAVTGHVTGCNERYSVERYPGDVKNWTAAKLSFTPRFRRWPRRWSLQHGADAGRGRWARHSRRHDRDDRSLAGQGPNLTLTSTTPARRPVSRVSQRPYPTHLAGDAVL